MTWAEIDQPTRAWRRARRLPQVIVDAIVTEVTGPAGPLSSGTTEGAPLAYLQVWRWCSLAVQGGWTATAWRSKAGEGGER
jgi:hypothetical protein